MQVKSKSKLRKSDRNLTISNQTKIRPPNHALGSVPGFGIQPNRTLLNMFIIFNFRFGWIPKPGNELEFIKMMNMFKLFNYMVDYVH